MSDTDAPAKLWPQPIEIIGVTGEYASGKTLFGATISPKRTLVFDTERSSGSYESLGFERISLQDVMQGVKPNGYKPIDVFTWWWENVRKIPRGKYEVIMIDTISEIEEGLVDWVNKNPGHFGRSSGQYAKMQGLMWGDVKGLWKQILSDLSARCQTFVFCVHMANVWSGDRPTGKRKPKGKETLMELASLYLLMERKPNDKGVLPAKPAAVVLKSRLVHTRLNPENMELELTPCLPPRLPICTPAEIRRYMLSPPDYKKLKKEEMVQEDKMSDEEKAQLALARAEAESDAERLRLERLNKQQEMLREQSEREIAAQAVTVRTATTEGMAKPQWPALPGEDQGITSAQIQRLLAIKNDLANRQGVSDDDWRAIVKSKGVVKAKELSETAAAELIVELEQRLSGGSAAHTAPLAAEAMTD